ncbi:MAG: alpha/beta hydrolase [Acidobacteria bacterium]|nr:alpha/beta hydrolase [Acidobacteriota bacterium]
MRFAFVSALIAASAFAELIPATKPVESAARTRTYIFKRTPQGELKVYVYLPEGWKAGQKRPAIVMFFGGGFTQGSPEQFRTKAEYLASRGMVAVAPEYRIKTKHNTSADKSVEDAKSAIRWMRINAEALGIDPTRIVGAGGSAGGTCAALSALSTAYEPDGEDLSVSSKPNVLVLYNPALAVPGGEAGDMFGGLLTSWKVNRGDPPMIFFFGTNDKLLVGSREVARRSAALGNRVELYTAPGQKHGFFNDSRMASNGSPGWHEVVLYRTDLFLSSLGYLKGEPAIKPDPALKLTRETL